MYEEGFLSVWVGDAESQQALEEYVHLAYSDEGDLIPSQLLKDFDLVDDDGDYNEYDEGCREISFYELGSRSLEMCLQEFSYSDQIVEKVLSAVSEEEVSLANAVVILFNYKASLGERVRAASAGVNLMFVGTMKYDM